MQRPDPARALHGLLERERQLVLSGRFDELAGLPDEKANLLGTLGAIRDRDALAALADMARRNQMLLDAAATGFREVRDRLSEIRRTAGTLDVYSKEGERRRVSTPSATVERRA
jgi:hypothetical protein